MPNAPEKPLIFGTKNQLHLSNLPIQRSHGILTGLK